MKGTEKIWVIFSVVRSLYRVRCLVSVQASEL